MTTTLKPLLTRDNYDLALALCNDLRKHEWRKVGVMTVIDWNRQQPQADFADGKSLGCVRGQRMTEREYRQDDETRGYCPTCGRELAALDVAGRGVCEEHGRVFADWTPRTGQWVLYEGDWHLSTCAKVLTNRLGIICTCETVDA